MVVPTVTYPPSVVRPPVDGNPAVDEMLSTSETLSKNVFGSPAVRATEKRDANWDANALLLELMNSVAVSDAGCANGRILPGNVALVSTSSGISATAPYSCQRKSRNLCETKKKGAVALIPGW